jgi:hypothetical protein
MLLMIQANLAPEKIGNLGGVGGSVGRGIGEHVDRDSFCGCLTSAGGHYPQVVLAKFG